MMRRRDLLLGIPAAAAARAQTRDEFTEHVTAFSETWHAFFLRYFGCPPGTTDFQACRPAMGSIDRKLFAEAGKRAEKLWKLKASQQQ